MCPLSAAQEYIRTHITKAWELRAGMGNPNKLMAVPTARVARTLAPLTFSTGHQLVGGVAPKPPLSPCTVPIHLPILLHNFYHSFVPLYSSIYSSILLHSHILPFILLSSFIIPSILLYNVTIRLIWCNGSTNV